MRHLLLLLGTVVGLFAIARAETDTPPPLTAATTAVPLVTPGEKEFEFTSKFTHHAYRIMISAPPVPDSGKPRPVLYVMDGYWYFKAAVSFAAEAGGGFQDPIIVGIGYPTDNTTKEFNQRRKIDLSILPPPDAVPPPDKSWVGDGDNYLRMLDEEVKPYIDAHYPVDKTKQILYGKSLGGLMVLRQLFRDPSAFQIYIAASPSIARSNYLVLQDEAAFSAKVKAGQVQARLLITSAEFEQYRGNDPKKIEEAKGHHMVDDAAQLAARLKALNPAKFTVDYAVFPGETHFTVSLAALGRAMCFAFDAMPHE